VLGGFFGWNRGGPETDPCRTPPTSAPTFTLGSPFPEFSAKARARDWTLAGLDRSDNIHEQIEQLNANKNSNNDKKLIYFYHAFCNVISECGAIIFTQI
jgi:hypothetical protein